MAPRNVGLNSTFDQQRSVINEISVDIENLTSSGIFAKTNVGIHTFSNIGVGTTNPETSLQLNGILSFTKGSSLSSPNNIADISIGNTSVGYGYGTNPGFLDYRTQNNVFIGNKIFETYSSGGLPAYNVVIGDSAGNSLGNGCVENVIIGRDAGYVNRGSGNNFIGNRTGNSNTTGYYNIFLGYDAGISNNTGYQNTFIGRESGYSNTTGRDNFYAGQFAGYYNQGGKFNLALGNETGNGFDGAETSYNANIHIGSVNGSLIGGSYQILIGSGNDVGGRYLNLPNPNKNYQFAVGIRTDANPSKYWLVGNENFNVGIGTTNPTESLTVYPKIQILNDASANGRLIFRAKPGNSYRWNIDNDGATNNLRFFREDDANAANGTTPFQITPTGNATLSGNLNAAGNYYVKLARTSNQTITSLSDTLIGFSAISDPNSWFNSGNNRITPNVAGNYYISAMVNWEAGAAADTVQTNIQIRRNGTTVALSVLGVQTHTYTMNVSAIVTMNGSTDYIELTAYTGNPTSQDVGGDAGGTLTKLEVFKIN